MRESKLIRSIRQYVTRSAIIVLRILVLYIPFKFFSVMALLIALPGLLAVIRFLCAYFAGEAQGKVQSLVIGTGLVAAVVVFIGGLLADMIAANCAPLAEIRGRQRLAEIEQANRR